MDGVHADLWVHAMMRPPACAPAFLRACSDVREQLAPACKKQVFKVQMDAALDYRADPQLYEACRDDADKACKDVKMGGGRVQACLVSGRGPPPAASPSQQRHPLRPVHASWVHLAQRRGHRQQGFMRFGLERTHPAPGFGARPAGCFQARMGPGNSVHCREK